MRNDLLVSAIDDFRRARRQADMEQILSRLSGRSADLLSYQEVRHKLKARESKTRELRKIRLDAIVGSVGRYNDFTRSFLPRLDSDQERWARLAVTDLKKLPPITVYQIGQAYFVEDGHHRVSVARQLGATHIQAYVTPVHSKVRLSPDIQPDELILKAEQVEFLEHTHLDEARPEADLSMTVPGQYQVIEEHIKLYQRGLKKHGQALSYQAAAASWYDETYLPVVHAIRERGILRDFPDRTEADLYVWISRHSAALEQELGWEVRTGAAATDLAAHYSPRPKRVMARVGGKLLDAVRPAEFKAGPPPGEWRKERLASGQAHRWGAFADILVPLSGQEAGWQALEQAIEIARLEDAQLHGLHVAGRQSRGQAKSQALQERFEQRCKTAKVQGDMRIESGPVAHTICEWARWADLVVVNLAHPPGPQALARLRSGFRSLLQRCSRPVLAVPKVAYSLKRALLAYDGSPKADEALYIATYIAGRWGLALVVVTAAGSRQAAVQTLERAQAYTAQHGVQATCVHDSGPAAHVILKTADKHKSNLIIMGGYGARPAVGVVLGSVVDHVLRGCRQPVLICR